MARDEIAGMPIGYFGASTGAAAALVAASEVGNEVRAVVSRGGRPDLAKGYLTRVTAPTLLIVGSRDEKVLKINHEAALQMTCDRKLAIVPGATQMAGSWFRAHLGEEAAA